jgi:N-acetylglucosamine kinase-like BadF-type ATPase
MSSNYLGVDGGQSATVALIGDDEGRVTGVGRAGPCNHVKGPGGRERFLNALRGSVAEACRAAGLAQARFAAAHLGLSGGPDDKAALVGEVLQAGMLSITHDAAIALDGALAGRPGVLVIAGTGSIAFGRDGQGKEARAGGWGYIFGDEGSAFDLARQALRAALRFEEGWGPRTALGAALLEASGAPSVNELLHWAYGEDYPRHRVAGWAELVDRTAAAGDAVAQEILRAAGQHLALFASAVRRQLFDEAVVPVSYTGGVFRSERVLAAFQTLVELDDSMKIAPPRHAPAAGALIGAYRLASKTVDLQGAPPLK